MDEVDIDNVEDLNELEARLYAQIHHEATNETNVDNGTQLSQNADWQAFDVNANKNDSNYEVSSNTNRILSKRYWASAADTVFQRQEQPQQSKQHLIRNPFKASSNHEQQRNMNQQPKRSESSSQTVLNPFKANKNVKSLVQINKEVNTEHTSTSEAGSLNVALCSTVNSENKKNKNASANQHIENQKQPTANLKLNPIADWMKRKNNHINKKSNCKSKNVNNKNVSIDIKQGIFSRQQQKLEKAKRIEEKKQKSKKAKKLSASIANKIQPSEVIDLDSDNESENSDVIVIPTAPPPTFTVDDSTDEDEKKDQVNITMEHEENAVDSTDVQFSATTASFIKPKEIPTQSLITVDGDDKRLENSSRCTSPCSIQSSDDFIRNIDRVRLLAGSRGIADDEDLLELTSDMNILKESSDISKQANDDSLCLDKIKKPVISYNEKEIREENVESSLEFAAPKTTKAQSQSKDYRVDHGQFKALDVYESESDITDNVYSKGLSKSTVIRQIDSSSDDVEGISTCSQRTKRLRKRRASSSNKESDHNNDHILTSSDDENVDDDNEVLRTPVAYIAKGVAVERYKPRKRNRSSSFCSPYLQRSKSANITGASDHMSDTEFLATLNNLAQGQDDEQQINNFEESEESDTENVPTAREMAEKILAQHSENNKIKESVAEDMALPKDILNELDKVFETIDKLDRQNSKRSSPVAFEISDSSDSDREKHLIYPSVPNEDAQIIKYSPKNATAKTRDENGSPIYNVIYSRGVRKPGGIGWNDEMRKFYNNSWNGEHFNLRKVLQKMNPEKNLWKIYTEDRLNIKSNKYSNIKCNNCCEFGHMRSKCKRPRKARICYMCGQSGHQEPRCPNTICLRCGNKTQVFTKSCNVCSYQNRLTCPICKIRGHSLDYCPDKWRRYHSTTEANVNPSNKVDYNPRKFCCICGGRGHISDNCRSALRFSEYPAITSNIKSHQKSYSDVVVRTPYNGIAINLMYEPCHEYKFDLAEQTSLDKYYGRFLKAVGLDFLLQRKRHINTMPTESAESSAKKTKRLSKKYEANPYLKAAAAHKKYKESMENAPNQVQEISESGNTDGKADDTQPEKEIINIEDKSENEYEVIDSEEGEEVTCNIQLNTILNKHDENFKFPKIVKVTTEKALNSPIEPSLILDSDSNYSFSEHFDIASNSGQDATPAIEEPIAIDLPISEELTNNQENEEERLVGSSSRPKPREMEALPDFIPLIDSTKDQSERNHDMNNTYSGISRKFVAAESDDEDMEENRRQLSTLSELPSEAKIYLTHFHSKYLLSRNGNTFLVKTSRTHNLKARLDFTSVGHVLIIFGLPSNQDKFQRELLLKYRELEDEKNQRQVQSSINIPKRTYVLIKFLRENITQLMSNLGNVNQLLKRLQFLERQQTKSGLKLAEKVRKSLNMILVGQAGLQDGTMHLDKLLMSLKTLLNDVSGEVAPPQLRSEITDHWKVIFSAYRHDNYQKLVDTYNKLVSKNRLPQLNIDPLLLGQKLLDTSLSEEQKQKLEQAKMPANTESSKQIVAHSLNQENAKTPKRQQNIDTSNISKPSTTNSPPNANKTKTNTSRVDISSSCSNIKTKQTSSNSSTLQKATKTPNNASKPAKVKASKATTSILNKTHKSPSAYLTVTKQPQKLAGPPPFSNPEKRSTVSTIIQQETDNWKSTCDTLLTEISSETPTSDKNLGGKVRDSKIPSTFWSRESMRYLDDCIRLVADRSEVVEKLQRVQNKSKNGKLSYNDYLAVIKLHTALNGK